MIRVYNGCNVRRSPFLITTLAMYLSLVFWFPPPLLKTSAKAQQLYWLQSPELIDNKQNTDMNQIWQLNLHVSVCSKQNNNWNLNDHKSWFHYWPCYKQIWCHLGKPSLKEGQKEQLWSDAVHPAWRLIRARTFLSDMSIYRKLCSCFLHNFWV